MTYMVPVTWLLLYLTGTILISSEEGETEGTYHFLSLVAFTKETDLIVAIG